MSGRSGERAREIVGVDGLTYVGEHGLELDPEAEQWAPRIHAFAADAGWPAEDKPLSAAFHYRTAADQAPRAACSRASSGPREAEGFRTRWGRIVLEVLPPLETSKGTAVRRLLAAHGLERALYAGDDTTDLDGFAALDGLAVRRCASRSCRPRARATWPRAPTSSSARPRSWRVSLAQL